MLLLKLKKFRLLLSSHDRLYYLRVLLKVDDISTLDLPLLRFALDVDYFIFG